MRYRDLLLPSLLMLAACSGHEVVAPDGDGDGVVGPGGGVESEVGVTADVDGTPFRFTDSSAFVLLTGVDRNTLVIIGWRKREGETEILQLWLDRFDSVGGHSLHDADIEPRGGMAAYVRNSDPKGPFWSDAPSASPSDSAWVTSYDSATGEVEGTFRFHGGRGAGDSVAVTNGRFKGVVQPYVPPTSIGAGATD